MVKKITPSDAQRQLQKRQLAKDILAGKPVGQALVDAGFSAGSHVTKSKDFQAYMRELMEAAGGITPEVIAKKVAEGLDAQKVFYDKGQERYSPDWYARHKYTETAIRLMGMEPPKQHEVNHGGAIVVRNTPGLSSRNAALSTPKPEELGEVVEGEFEEVGDDDGDGDSAGE